MKDVFDKTVKHERVEMFRQADAYDLVPYFRELEGKTGPTVRMEGVERIMLGSNNYLGLTEDPRVQEAAEEALRTYGTAVTGSRLLNGTLRMHNELEHELAQWLGTEAALVFTTGYQANVGAIGSLVGPTETVIVDAADHASIMDGVMMSRAKVRAFKHNRLDRLELMLQRAQQDEGGVLVIVDGVFSMEGEVCDLRPVVELCRAHGARLMVDEAHSVGVLGARGAGVAELLGVEDDVDLRMGTFSKSLASCGGFIAGPRQVIEYLRLEARSFLFTASQTPSATAAALAAVRICRSSEGPALFERALHNARYLHAGLAELGWDVLDLRPAPGRAPHLAAIVSIFVGEDWQAAVLWKALYDAGLYTNVAIYPAVRHGQALLRTSVTANHQRHHLDRALEIFAAQRASSPVAA